MSKKILISITISLFITMIASPIYAIKIIDDSSLNLNITYYFIIIALIVIELFFMIVYIVHMKVDKERRRLLETDTLTGAMTRHKIFKEIKKTLKNAEACEYQIISCDIDNFKSINRYFGYAEGDRVLREYVDLVKKNYPKATLIARESNDIFIIFQKNIHTETLAYGTKNYADYLQPSPIQEFQNKYNLKIKYGIYVIEDTHQKVEYMVDCAHMARTFTKSYYNTLAVKFTQDMETKHYAIYRLISQMDTALKNGEFYPVLQPKYDVKTEKLVGAEALARWRTKDGEQIYPTEFAPLFEKNGFISRLDYYMFEQICKFINETEYILPRIAVNVSYITALTGNILVQNYIQLMDKYNINTSQIEIEITESAFNDDFEIMHSVVNDFKQNGLHISIDDFGTGASSLNRLKDINIDTIKLDKEFINHNLSMEKGIPILNSIIKLAHELNIQTVAEGVETTDQLQILKMINCDVVQGFYFAQPLELADFCALVNGTELLENSNTHKKKDNQISFHLNIDRLSTPMIICENNPNMKIIKANKEFYELIGYTPNETLDELENEVIRLVVKGSTKSITENNSICTIDIKTKLDEVITITLHVKEYSTKEILYINLTLQDN